MNLSTSLHPRNLTIAIVCFLYVASPLSAQTGVPDDKAPTAISQTTESVARLRATLQNYKGPSLSKSEPAVLAFSPDNKLIAIRSDKRTISICDAATGERRFTLDAAKGELDAFSFSPDGKMIATRYVPNKEVMLWDSTTGKLLHTLDGIASGGRYRKGRGAATTLRKEMMPIPFSPDGQWILNEQPGDITTLWNASTGKLEHKLDRETRAGGFGYNLKSVLSLSLENLFFVESAQWSPDGKYIVTLDRDHTPKLWDAATGKLRAVIAAPTDNIRAVIFTPDARTLAAFNAKSEMRLVDVESGEIRSVAEAAKIAFATWSDDGKTIAALGFSQDVRLLDAQTLKERATLENTKQNMMQGGAFFSPDGRSLIVFGNKRYAATVWDVATGELKYTLPKGEDDTQWVAFSPDTRLIITANDDGVTVWDATNGKPVQNLDHRARSPIRFSPDGRTLATGAKGGTALLWDIIAPQPN